MRFDESGYRVVTLPAKYSRKLRIKEVMESLPARERLILAAAAVCSQREIALVVGISQPAVAKALKKSRR